MMIIRDKPFESPPSILQEDLSVPMTCPPLTFSVKYAIIINQIRNASIYQALRVL